MSGSRRNDDHKAPKGWMNCPREASNIIWNTFVAFKTPLDTKFRDDVPIHKRFYANRFLSNMDMNGVSIGLWIDLTNTSRYYNRSEIERTGCRYVKIPCAGHRSPPTYEQTQQFLYICSEFTAQNDTQYIGVHCTHGFNRTGFMIASYLIEVLGFDVFDAIDQFAYARPPGIYKQNKIDELFLRYSNRQPILAPDPPRWSIQ